MGKHSIRNEIEKKNSQMHKDENINLHNYLNCFSKSLDCFVIKSIPYKMKTEGCTLLNICGDEKVEQRKSKCTILVPYCSSDLVKKSIAPNTSSLHLQMSTIFIEESNNSIELFSNYS